MVDCITALLFSLSHEYMLIIEDFRLYLVIFSDLSNHCSD